jgi:hypothetical protein
MRILLAGIFVCAIGLTEASALPIAGSSALSISKAAPIVQVTKRSRAPARRQSHSHGGIHPLVGSGDY